jgi:hypothetical protein
MQDPKPKYKTMSPRAAVRTLAIGLTLIFSGFTIGIIHSTGRGPGVEWIRSWYDHTYYSVDKRGFPEATQRGYMIISIMVIIGIVFSAIGIASYFQNLNSD